jgi:hypothetical protein
MQSWGRCVAAAVLALGAHWAGLAAAQDCRADNICAATSQSTGTMTIDVHESDGRRNDNFQTRITARIGDGPLLYDQIVYRDFPDPMAQAAVEAAREAIRARGGSGVTIAAPDFIEEDFSEELDQIFTETSEFDRPGGTLTSVQTTSGDAPNNVVLAGDRGGCFDAGSTGPTNTPPFTGRFPDCDTYDETPVPPFTVNTNTHTTVVTEHVYYSFTNEDWIIRQHYAVVGTSDELFVEPATLADGALGVAYRQEITATGGVAPYAFDIAAGGPPAGIELSGAGILSGTPAAGGSFPLTVRATDANGKTGEASYTLRVTQAATSVSIASDVNPSSFGQPVTFTATIATPPGGPAAGGTVSFFDGPTLLGAVDQTSGAAALTTSALAAGTHSITAAYAGSADYGSSVSPPLTQQVRALGTVIIRQTVIGSDGSFPFTSAEPDLNFTIETQDGVGDSPAVSLSAGSYRVQAADRSADGLVLSSITCNDGDSIGDVDAGEVEIVLAAQEQVVCTFASASTREITSEVIQEFMDTRAALILENQPDGQRRIDRLNGVAGINTVESMLGGLPGLAGGRSMSVSASLASMRHPGDSESAFDIWFDGRFARFEANGASGNFGLASFGMDYLLNENLLVGVFAQIDRMDGFVSAAGGSAEGTGWIAGPYVTARLADNLFFDLIAGAGRSYNEVNPLGTYTDAFDATRWLVSGTLQGDWKQGAWTLSPRARLSWFHEQSDPYVDSLGVAIPSIETGLGQFAFGPGVSYRHHLESGAVLDYSLRLDGIVDFGKGDEDFRTRIEGGIAGTLANGWRIGLSLAYGGIGSDAVRSYGGSLKISAPLN